jgi:hypothetical protein
MFYKNKKGRHQQESKQNNNRGVFVGSQQEQE